MFWVSGSENWHGASAVVRWVKYLSRIVCDDGTHTLYGKEFLTTEKQNADITIGAGGTNCRQIADITKPDITKQDITIQTRKSLKLPVDIKGGGSGEDSQPH